MARKPRHKIIWVDDIDFTTPGDFGAPDHLGRVHKLTLAANIELFIEAMYVAGLPPGAYEIVERELRRFVDRVRSLGCKTARDYLRIDPM